MNRKRCKEELILEILNIAEDGAIKTKIVYGSGINFTLADKYLDTLIKNKLIERSGNRYITTVKGKESSKKLKELIDIIGCV